VGFTTLKRPSFRQLSTLDVLRQRLAKYDQPDFYTQITAKNSSVKNLKRASVLIPISFKNDNYELSNTVYTLSKRTDKMSSFRGDISFLGGKRDKNDTSDVATAYREANEEAGIEAKDLTYMATLCPIVTVNCILVTPILVHFNKKEYKPILNTEEVDMIFELPTERFLSDIGKTTTTYETESGESYLVHHFKDILSEVGDREIETWGYTAFMCVIVSMLIHDRPIPFNMQSSLEFRPDNVNKLLERFLYKKLRLFQKDM